jgi:hypothetical protein
MIRLIYEKHIDIYMYIKRVRNVYADTGFRKLKYNDTSRPHFVNFVNKFG